MKPIDTYEDENIIQTECGLCNQTLTHFKDSTGPAMDYCVACTNEIIKAEQVSFGSSEEDPHYFGEEEYGFADPNPYHGDYSEM